MRYSSSADARSSVPPAVLLKTSTALYRVLYGAYVKRVYNI